MDAAGLGNVVGCLLLWVIGDMAGHGGGDDKGTGATLFKMVADSLGAVEGAVEIGLNDFIPVLD